MVTVFLLFRNANCFFNQDCRLNLSVCPGCKMVLGKTRSLVAEKMLDKLPKTCKFADNGCPLEFEQVFFNIIYFAL